MSQFPHSESEIGSASLLTRFSMSATLVAAAANIELANNTGITPLMAAATYGHRGCVEMLIEAGAGVLAAVGRLPLLCSSLPQS